MRLKTFHLLPVMVMAMFSPHADALPRVFGYCTQGGQVVVTNSAKSTTKVQQSYPSCTITVYNTGGSTGYVNTSGTTITWVSGTYFNANGGWNGQGIVINSVGYTVSTCASTTSCTLTSSAGTQTGVAYSMVVSPATIFSTATGTPLSNPFTSSTTGYWNFYAANGTYDVQANGAGLPAPVTWGAISVTDPIATVPNWISYNPINGSAASQCTAAVNASLTLVVSEVMPGLTTQTFSCQMEFKKGGMIQPASGQTVTLTGSVTAPPIQIFDTSLGGAGSVLLTSPQIPSVYANWFGAKMDGSTDDAGAWNAAIASCTACTITMPTNATSHVGSTVNLSGAGQRLYCQGKSSIISGTGITIVKMSGAITGGQTLENCQIQDPTGSSSTIGLSVDNGSGNANQVYIHNVTVGGNSGSETGTGILLNGSVNVTLDKVVEHYFNIGLQHTNAAGNTTVTLLNSALTLNATKGWDIETQGDVRCIGSDIESNGTDGLYINNGSSDVYSAACHYESNTSHHVNVNSGYLQSFSSLYAGGAILIASGGYMTSWSENMSGLTITNNGVRGGAFIPPLIINDALLEPTLAGSGWTRVYRWSGEQDYNNPGTTFSFTGAPLYQFQSAMQTANGTRFTVANNGGPCTASTPTNLTGTSTSGWFQAGAGASFPLTCQYIMTVGGASPISAPNGWQITGSNGTNPAAVIMRTSNATQIQFQVVVTTSADQIFISAHDPW